MRNKLVSIVIPVYNAKGFIKYCFQGIFKNTLYPYYEIIVVDDASTDGGEKDLMNFAKRRNIKLIRNEKNLGFAKACNKGADIANGEYLVFLNIDTYPCKGWLHPLIEVLQKNSEIGAVSGKWVYFHSRRVQHAGIVFGKINNNLLPYQIYHYIPEYISLVNKEREYPSTACSGTIIRKEIFFEVGKFDENFFNGCEDHDLWEKIKEKGYKIYYTPKSKIFHYAHHVTSCSPQNISLFLKKWHHRLKECDCEYYIVDSLYPEVIKKIAEIVGMDFVFMGISRESDLQIFKNKNLNETSMKRYIEKIWKNLFYFAKKQAKSTFVKNISLKIRALNLLAHAYLKMEKLSLAEKKLHELISISSNSQAQLLDDLILNAYYNLGSIQEKNKKFKTAKKYFLKVITLSKKDTLKNEKYIGGAYFHLAKIYWALKNKKKAIENIERCLKIIPHHEKAMELKEKLQER